MILLPSSLRDCNGDDAQKWHFGFDGYIRSYVEDSMCLDAGLNPSDLTSLSYSPCSYDDIFQRWTRTDDGKIANEEHGKLISIANGCDGVVSSDTPLIV